MQESIIGECHGDDINNNSHGMHDNTKNCYFLEDYLAMYISPKCMKHAYHMCETCMSHVGNMHVTCVKHACDMHETCMSHV